MALHDDLLHQARMLARHEPRRPRQASLRRAVSAAYYALFHSLTREAADRWVTGDDREPLRRMLQRAFDHAIMAEACKEIARQNGGKLAPALPASGAQPELLNVAEAFLDLQQARHEADYDLARMFARQEVLDLIVRAEDAIADRQTVRRTLPADVFRVALLAKRGMCR